MASSPTFDQLCEICSSLFDNQTYEYLLSHGGTNLKREFANTTFETLVSSARQGCHICSILYDDFRTGNRLPDLDEPTISNYASTSLSIRITYLAHLNSNAIILKLEGWNLKPGHVEISQISVKKLENIRASRIITAQTLAPSSIRQIKMWITDCKTNHRHCRMEVSSTQAVARKPPTRLLDIGTDEASLVRLRDTNEIDLGVTYVTLSHCWGRHPTIKLLNNNIVKFYDSISVPNLPKTFRDAIEVTRSLGYRYLWIDSLCIVQDCNDEWLHESSFIGDIYKNATLNLAATASSDGDGGLFHHSKSLALHPCIINFRHNSSDQASFICQQSLAWDRQVERGPLAKRAWVVQERLISPRIAHFAKDQIYWECQSTRDSEFLPELPCSSEDLDFLKELSTLPRYTYDRWDETVMRYTQCLLTFESDKLIAISGLAKQACQQLGCAPSAYLAGLWAGNMPIALLWRTNPHIRRRKRVLERAPSWSWSYMNGEIYAPTALQSHEGYVLDNGLRANLARSGATSASQIYCRFISADIKHLKDPFGATTGGYIRLQGPFCVIKATGPRGDESLVDLSHGILDCETSPFSIMTKSIRWDDEAACLDGMNNPIFFLLVEIDFGWARGLVLKPVVSRPGCYQRLGQIMARPSNLDVLLDLSRRPAQLEQGRYLAADQEHGFTIDIT